ncbi:HNH endonuclease signature motif containing protein [Cryobacterium roopkundense]|uniref:HNH nuclease domain-containing protein n=4 Tax=Cryobacterium roopkundense TaxID=1001240 RepID=A0A7W8ZT04_9MICO|nr:HNH endonuclease signature motif containing protein [Cryobacterium roopkundense]MBB5639644.1 hypothetical protein [Cryobacterium roopkundense]
MTTSTDLLVESTAALADTYSHSLGGGVCTEEEPDAGLDVQRMTNAGLLASMAATFEVVRLAQALLVREAGELNDRFEHDTGIAAQTGNRNAAAALTDIGHISMAEAGRLVRVGKATRPRMSLIGEHLPPEYSEVAKAVNAGALPVDSALYITANLAQAAPRATTEDLDAAEKELVEFAVTNPVDSVRKLSIRYRDALDVDGVEPREEVLVSRRGLKRMVLPNGMKRYILDADPVSAAYLDTAIDGMTSAELRKPRFEAKDDPDGCGDNHEIIGDGRTMPQLNFDAFIDIVRHALSCTEGLGALDHTTIIVRMTLESLQSGLGEAQLDGIEQPISAGTARKMAAEACLIPMVLGGKSEVLDFGLRKRLFTTAQKLAAIERDGGCATAGCNRPPSYAEGHHIRWYKAHDGPTNQANCVMLCSACHHRIHREGWDVVVRDNVVYFIPSASVDPRRTPRRGGRPPVPTPKGHDGPHYKR